MNFRDNDFSELLGSIEVPERLGQESSDKELTLDEQLDAVDRGKAPVTKYYAETGTLGYKDEALEKIRQLRRKLHFSDRDPLAMREKTIERGLEELGYKKSDMGKTGDSLTGEVTADHRKIANSQVEDAKEDIILTRLSLGKKITR